MSGVRVRINTGVVSGVFFFGLYWFVPSLFICLLVSLAGWILLVEWPRVQGQGVISSWYQVPSWSTFLYPVVPLILLIAHVIEWRAIDPFYALYPFVAAWIVDAAAYTIGSLWGVHKCFPTISPKKTWEGVVGGVAILGVLHAIAWSAGVTDYSLPVMLLGAVIIGITAVIGDAVMSWFKRQNGLKDTGALLPGHGGLLDRFDSVLAVIVVLKICEFLRVI